MAREEERNPVRGASLAASKEVMICYREINRKITQLREKIDASVLERSRPLENSADAA
jgi:hypothetical protein